MRRLTPLAVGSLRRTGSRSWMATLATAEGATRVLVTPLRERAMAVLGEGLAPQPSEAAHGS